MPRRLYFALRLYFGLRYSWRLAWYKAAHQGARRLGLGARDQFHVRRQDVGFLSVVKR